MDVNTFDTLINQDYEGTLAKYNQLTAMDCDLSDANCIPHLHEMATCLSKLNRNEESLEMQEILIESLVNLNAGDETFLMQLMENKALTLNLLGRTQEGMSILKIVVKWRLSHLGLNHPDSLNTLHLIATGLINQGRYSEALEGFQQVLKLRTSILGQTHPDTILTQYMLQLALSKLN